MAMFKAFKPSGMEKIARSMGYQGNMQGFQDYLAQDPMRQQQMQGYTRQAMQMANGGMVNAGKGYTQEQLTQKRLAGGAIEIPRDAAGIPLGGMSTSEMYKGFTGPSGKPMTVPTATKLKTIQDNLNKEMQSDPRYTAFQDYQKQIAQSEQFKNPEFQKQIAQSQQFKNPEFQKQIAQSQQYQDMKKLQKEYEDKLNKSIGDITVDRMSTGALPAGGVTTVATTPVAGEQMLQTDTGMVDPRAGISTAIADATKADTITSTSAKTMSADLTQEDVSGALEKLKAAQGQVSEKAQVKAEQGELSPEALASVPRMEDKFIEKASSNVRTVQDVELAKAAGENAEAIRTEIAQADLVADAVAAQGVVTERQIPPPAQIAEEDMAQAEIITADGLADDARMVAAKLEKFTVDNETLAKAAQGDVDAKSTVQGQLTSLMKDFDDGTPSWSAGAIRAANAAMASRGLGRSSVASAAIVQAVMESAIPIAQADAQVFERMMTDNLNRQQEVSLANAAAQQGLQLTNLSYEQETALQNSAKEFDVQMQNLSNTQSTVLANAQIKAALQGQNLSNQQQTNIVTAARYAENANINLNFEQQTSLQNNTNELKTNLENLSSKQQAYVTNAQLAASLQGQVLSNEQQVAINNAAKFSEANNITFTAEQQTTLHNSELMKTIGLANLSTEQASVLQNAATTANMDIANLNNRQQASVQNAKAFLDMDMANMSNEQQTAVFKTQQLVQSMFSDQAAENASAQFNASSINQVNQFFENLQSQTSQFNASQANAQAQFNAGQVNTIERFNQEIANQRDQFNAQNQLVIAQNNATWRREIATADTAAVNRANELNAKAVLDISNQAYNNLWQYYGDTMEWAWTSAESELDRLSAISIAQLSASATKDAQAAASKTAAGSAIGSLIGTLGSAFIEYN